MEFTRHWEESLGRFFVLPELEVLETESSLDFIDRHRNDLSVASYQAVLLLSENEWQSVPVFTVKGEPVVFYLDREEMHQSIAQCLEYFTGIEEYEKCAKLVKIKEIHCKD